MDLGLEKMEFDILIPTEKEGYQYVTLVVDPDEYCAATLEEYKATKLVNGLPSYLEPVFINGEEIRLCDDDITFYDYGIQDGETLHAVLRVRDVHVFIHNVCDNEMVTVDTLMSSTVSNLKMIARKDERLSASRFLPRELVLEEGVTILEEMKRLSDYSIQNYTQLNLDLQRYSLSVLVPTYVRMENIVAQPDETIAAIVKKIMSIQEFKYSISTRNKKMIVRSAVRNTNGTFTYMYFDLICGGRMQIFMDESSRLETKRYSFVVEHTNTVNDIYDRIELHQDLVVDESELQSDWPKCHLFDCTWTRTFAPQIEAAAPSMLDRGSLTLFFFPQRLKIVSMGRVSPYRTVAEIKARVCQTEGIKARTCAIMHSFSENYLKEERQLHNYHPIFNYEYCLTLTRPRERRVTPTDHIKVYVQWPSRAIDPVAVAVEPDDTVIHLKYIIEDELNVPLFMQRLHYEGTNLTWMNNRLLTSYGIRDGSMVQLLPIPEDEFFYFYVPNDEEFYDRRHLRSNLATMNTNL